ncbi:DUF4394 domain-containing protein [Streptomyces chengbuensis]|uniref:DUF4394 domain-containing protein n=1 Tax=Streptomyces chengbuensis TaxID=3053466 RepID=UPI0025B34B67|nr:DUF4394 domain-containing protein [Streptomyces sp. HUAS CB01]WJY48471.1 DUF4394 domain-containing protein [Streptomyces sp. HUAS CB01]
MRRAVLGTALAAAVLSITSSALAATSPSGGSEGKGLRVIGLTADQRLVEFRADRPDSISSSRAVTGLQGDTTLVGFDFRVQDNLLYAVGNAGGVYTLRTRTAVATKVSQLSVPLSGANFGVDFNPAADRLRIISDTGQNLRHDVTAAVGGTVTDTVLTNVPSPNPALGVTGAAYTNNDLSVATATTLYDIDTVNDLVSLQSPANTGTLAPTGNIGVDAGPNAGFDIYYAPKEGVNTGYAALRVANSHRFYRINLQNGAAKRIGSFPAGRQVTDIALPLNQK